MSRSELVDEFIDMMKHLIDTVPRSEATGETIVSLEGLATIGSLLLVADRLDAILVKLAERK